MIAANFPNKQFRPRRLSSLEVDLVFKTETSCSLNLWGICDMFHIIEHEVQWYDDDSSDVRYATADSGSPYYDIW